MKINVLTTTGEKKEELSFDFEKKASDILISNVILSNLANKRTAIAHTKTRDEVSGSGAKPWQQKGTGRARHGSIRSPIWIGGGITFGPRKTRNFSKRINAKQNSLVLAYIFSEKAQEGKLIIIDKIENFSGKTRDILPFFAKLGVTGKVLMVVDNDFAKTDAGRNMYRACRNSQLANLINVSKINAYSFLKYEWTVLTKTAMESLIESFSKLKSERKIVVKEEKVKKSAEKKSKVASSATRRRGGKKAVKKKAE